MSYDGNVAVEVFNISGQVVYKSDIYLEKGNNLKDLMSNANIPKGVHLISVANDFEKFTVKVIGQ